MLTERKQTLEYNKNLHDKIKSIENINKINRENLKLKSHNEISTKNINDMQNNDKKLN